MFKHTYKSKRYRKCICTYLLQITWKKGHNKIRMEIDKTALRYCMARLHLKPCVWILRGNFSQIQFTSNYL